MIGAVVTIGIGQVCKDILELPESYGSAREAVSYRVIYGTSRAINMKEAVPKKEPAENIQESDTELAELFKMIRFGSEEDVQKAAARYLDRINYSKNSLQQYHIDIMELISALYRFAIKQNITADDFSEDIRVLYSRLLDMEQDAMQKWLTDRCLFYHRTMVSERNSSTKSFVFKAKEYVHNHYADGELSLDRICEVLGVSNSYFSTVFKKETGSSFIHYLTDYRMDQASGLLTQTDEKSYMIAKKVGYTDPNYFSYVFKRQFGVSPSKYRTEHAESDK